MMNDGVRKPVGITSHNGKLVVVCDDGTLWQRNEGFKSPVATWENLPEPVPGTDVWMARGEERI